MPHISVPMLTRQRQFDADLPCFADLMSRLGDSHGSWISIVKTGAIAQTAHQSGAVQLSDQLTSQRRARENGLGGQSPDTPLPEPERTTQSHSEK